MFTEEVQRNEVKWGPAIDQATGMLSSSEWLLGFPKHLKRCSHYRIMFYDELPDVICEDISTDRLCSPKDWLRTGGR